MDRDVLKTFVIVCETKNLSRAAEILYVTQPSVTNRIHQLEEELGATLLIRQRGKRELALTERGKRVLDIAKEICVRYEDLSLEKERFAQSLTVSTIPSFVIPVAADICRELSRKRGVNISLYTYQSDDVFDLVASKKVEVAFSSAQREQGGVTCVPVFSQNYQVICLSNKTCEGKPVDGASLNTDYEIYQRWDKNFEYWHELTFGKDQPKLRVDSYCALRELLREEKSWSIVQESNVYKLAQELPLKISKLINPPPSRVCYLLTNSFPDAQTACVIGDFKTLLSRYVEEKAYLHPPYC